jgi:hypothetical protein
VVVFHINRTVTRRGERGRGRGCVFLAWSWVIIPWRRAGG